MTVLLENLYSECEKILPFACPYILFLLSLLQKSIITTVSVPCQAMSSRMVTLFPTSVMNYDWLNSIILVLFLLAVDVLYIVIWPTIDQYDLREMTGKLLQLVLTVREIHRNIVSFLSWMIYICMWFWNCCRHFITMNRDILLKREILSLLHVIVSNRNRGLNKFKV